MKRQTLFLVRIGSKIGRKNTYYQLTGNKAGKLRLSCIALWSFSLRPQLPLSNINRRLETQKLCCLWLGVHTSDYLVTGWVCETTTGMGGRTYYAAYCLPTPSIRPILRVRWVRLMRNERWWLFEHLLDWCQSEHRRLQEKLSRKEWNCSGKTLNRYHYINLHHIKLQLSLLD